MGFFFARSFWLRGLLEEPRFGGFPEQPGHDGPPTTAAAASNAGKAASKKEKSSGDGEVYERLHQLGRADWGPLVANERNPNSVE